MKVSLVILAAVAVLAVCDARRRPTTMRPCPGRCSLEWIPVCAQDASGDYYLFTNRCLLRLCACRTNTEFTQLDNPDDCPPDAKMKCPDQLNPGYGDDSLEAQSSDSSDSSDAVAGREGAHFFPSVAL